MQDNQIQESVAEADGERLWSHAVSVYIWLLQTKRLRHYLLWRDGNSAPDCADRHIPAHQTPTLGD